MDLDISRLSYQGLIQKEKVDINCEKGAQIRVVAKNIVTQGWSNIMVMKHKEAIHYICFSLSCHYVYIMLLVWSRNWIMFTGYFYFWSGLNLVSPKLVWLKTVYRCWKQPVSTPDILSFWKGYQFPSIFQTKYLTLSVGYSLLFCNFIFKPPSNFLCLDLKIAISVFFKII